MTHGFIRDQDDALPHSTMTCSGFLCEREVSDIMFPHACDWSVLFRGAPSTLPLQHLTLSELRQHYCRCDLKGRAVGKYFLFSHLALFNQKYAVAPICAVGSKYHKCM